MVGYLACALVLSTSSVNALVYSSNAAKEAAAAGFILLSIVTVCNELLPRMRDHWMALTNAPRLSGRMDPLLRLRTLGCPPRFRRLLRSQQGLYHEPPDHEWRL